MQAKSPGQTCSKHAVARLMIVCATNACNCIVRANVNVTPNRYAALSFAAPDRRCHVSLTPRPCSRQLLRRQIGTLSVSASEGDQGSKLDASGSMSDTVSPNTQALLTGQLCLCGVAILWGSYSPIVRYIYASPGPPSPAAFTAVRAVVQAGLLLASDFFVRHGQTNTPQKAKRRRSSRQPALSKRQEQSTIGSSSIMQYAADVLNSTSSNLWVAGTELGFWNFCGSTFQALGLQYTSATRGAFLIQVRLINSLDT